MKPIQMSGNDALNSALTQFLRGAGGKAVARLSFAASFKFSSLIRNLVVAITVLIGYSADYYRPLDDSLQSARFSLLHHRPTGNFVFLEIDAASLQKIGVWPWPRSVDASIIDRLVALGARTMAFDVDFSAASTPENDAAFAAALSRAGGYALIAAFEQSGGAQGGRIINEPIPGLAAASDVISVAAPLDPGGLVRDYRTWLAVGGRRMQTLGAALAQPQLRGSSEVNEKFGINFGVDVGAIDRISVAELLAGEVAAGRIRGRDIVIGASALELHDFFMAPRFGMIPGALVHILAAETLVQDLALGEAGKLPIGLLVIGLALAIALIGHRLSPMRWLIAAGGVSLVVECAALLLQHDFSLQLETGAVQIAIGGFLLCGLLVDLSMRRKLHAQAEGEREFMHATLRQVIADDFDGVVIANEAGMILAHSKLAQQFLSGEVGSQETLVLPPTLATVVADAFEEARSSITTAPMSGNVTLLDARMGERHFDYVVTVSAIEQDNLRRVACLTFRDVTDQRAQESRIKFLATHDPVTGAWLRHELIEQIEARFGQNSTRSPNMAIMLIDLRRFNLLINALGQAIGEQLLKSVVARLRGAGHDMIARVGDSSFAIAAPNLSGRLALLQLSRALIARLCEPYVIDGRKIVVGVVLGVAISGPSGIKAANLLTHSRIAQAAARKLKGNRYEIFSPAMEAELGERQWVETALRQALSEGQFSLAYQPQVDLDTGDLVGAEALLRWTHPDRGAIPPALFVPVAEETGLIVDIGRWVMQTACREAARWPEHLRVSVNASPLQFESAELVADVQDSLERAGLAPNRLVVEITESALVSGATEITDILNEFRALGIGIALDDFGTGYSSLGYLSRLPIDKIKIDQSFVRNITEDAGAAAIVQSILTLAKSLSKDVIAEGVETPAQAQLLKTQGCQIVQGFYFGRPVSGEEIRRLTAPSVSRRKLLRAV